MKLSVALFVFILSAPSMMMAQTSLDAARYAENGDLLFPDNADEWILMGATLGGDYNDEPFSPDAPGSFGLVQMEPAAYRYFLENHEYADGTMFLLSFYDRESKSEPQLQGFVQGALTAREIHVIDKARFAEGRGFFFFRAPVKASAAKIPDGSECVSCHTEHGGYDGTFVQFYPAIREHFE